MKAGARRSATRLRLARKASWAATCGAQSSSAPKRTRRRCCRRAAARPPVGEGEPEAADAASAVGEIGVDTAATGDAPAEAVDTAPWARVLPSATRPRSTGRCCASSSAAATAAVIAATARAAAACCPSAAAAARSVGVTGSRRWSLGDRRGECDGVAQGDAGPVDRGVKAVATAPAAEGLPEP